ncbi:hypothetical protein [Ancylomarina longa]|uniref:T9SS C-terminal target domain-containing protein n=1 Tax=Ancylomarina longa TaxID=2487017 RepID=A0A434AFC5_9BACT|nr:hypothetical protein [Ancylomarina longa]RUT73048.1 hypothetical protein DLK05_15360 [Ancylomarina longa]
MKSFLFSTIFLLVLASCQHKSPTKELSEVSNLKDSSSTIIPTIIYNPILVSDQLSAKVDEQSGLVWYNQLFWINNDSDCAASLFAYNRNGNLRKELRLSQAINLDWEDLTEDSTFLYIGDFGNNFGDRRDLRVLRLRKSQISKDSVSVQECEKLKFEWADQKDFSKRKQTHNYDCEAFFAYKDSLYFFSKNWGDHKTRMYVMSKDTSYHKLKPNCEFDVDFMVTGADIRSDGKMVALVGYKDFHTYMMILFQYQGTDFFGGKQLFVDLKSLGRAQTEGIVFGENDSLFISTEQTKLPQSLFKVEWQSWPELSGK